MTLTAHC
jgi:hypothetical protein